MAHVKSYLKRYGMRKRMAKKNMFIKKAKKYLRKKPPGTDSPGPKRGKRGITIYEKV